MDLKALDVCRRFLDPTPLPPVAETDDARVAFLKDEAALFSANADKAAANKCVAGVQQRYAGPKPKEASK